MQSAQGRDPGRGSRDAVPARRRRARPRRCCRSSTSPAIQYVVEEAVQRRAHRHPHHHRPQQARGRGPLRPQLRARALPRSDGQARPAEGGAVRVRPRRHPLRAPARSARSRPRGVGRASPRRRRAVRGAARRRHHGRRRRRCSVRCSRPRTARARGDRHCRRCGPRRSRRTAASDPTAAPVDGLVEMRGIVEKPTRDEAPSNLAVIGRYVFTPEIFDALDRIEPGAGGELQLTDAIALLLEASSRCTARSARRPLRRRAEDRLPHAPTSSSRSTAPTSARRSRRSCSDLVQRRGLDVIPLADAQRTHPRRRRHRSRHDRSPSTTRVGLVLAEAVVAAEPVPPFANTGMDGYAVRAGRHRRPRRCDCASSASCRRDGRRRVPSVPARRSAS